MTRKKKRDNPVFVACLMLFLAVSAVFVTLEIVDHSNGKSTTNGESRPVKSHFSSVSNPQYAFAQAEQLCLAQAKQTMPFPNAIYVDDRSTLNQGGGRYRVFLKLDPSSANGSESIYVCNVGSELAQLKIRSLKEIRAVGGDNDENLGIKGLLKALRNR